MGISGLLPFLKQASTSCSIRDYEGSTVAVDTYCWIYRGAFSCAEDLALGRETDGHVKYVLRYVNKLLEWGIKPIMIFDGSCLPSKKNTELKRKESKELYRKKAAQLIREGRNNEARECFQRCIECTPKMALDVIKALHQLGVDVLVAPYEADAQLAYLNRINVAQLIITEDSDLILFGCEKIFYKLDINGNGQLVEKQKIISITQFDSPDNFERFRWMCILSGCDYLENLPGIGLGKAKKLLKSIKKSDIEHILRQIPKVLKMPNLIITDEYIDLFKKADKTFKYQIAFDPLQRKLMPLNPYQDDFDPNEDMTYAGFFYEEKMSLQHALGNLEVNTRDVVNDFDPEKWNYKPPSKFSKNTPSHMRSIWSSLYIPYKKANPFNMCNNSSKEKDNKSSTLNTSNLNKALNKENSQPKRKFESIEPSSSVSKDIIVDLNEYCYTKDTVIQSAVVLAPEEAETSPIINKESDKNSSIKKHFPIFSSFSRSANSFKISTENKIKFEQHETKQMLSNMTLEKSPLMIKPATKQEPIQSPIVVKKSIYFPEESSSVNNTPEPRSPLRKKPCRSKLTDFLSQQEHSKNELDKFKYLPSSSSVN